MRGFPVHDVDRCVGCGACSNKCPTDSISVKYSSDKVMWILNLARCIRCGYCVDNCPTNALAIGQEYSYIGKNISEMYIVHELDIAKCLCSRNLNFSKHVFEFVKDKVKTEARCQNCRIENLINALEKFRRE